jgi:hypothetical protein
MYSKIFQQIFQSSIASNYELRHIFMDLCVLADKNGRIDHTYEAIARITNVPAEKVVLAIGQLMRPDPESRCQELEGARLVLIDPNRAWGWRVINYSKYRNRQYDDLDKRRAYKRAWMQKNRPSRAKNPQGRGGHGGVDKGGQRWTGVDKGGQGWTKVENAKTQNPNGKQLIKSTVDKGGHKAEAEAEAYKYPLPSPKGRQLQAKANAVIDDIEEAKQLMCERILNGKDPARPWSYQAMQELARQMPIPRLEIERVSWFRGMANDGSPELAARKPITENGLTTYWSDEVTRANAFWQKLNGWSEKKEAVQ